MGVSSNDYGELLQQADGQLANAYYATGNALSVLPGRLSYTLGLQGLV